MEDLEKEFEDKGYFRSRDDEYKEYKRKKEIEAQEKAEQERKDTPISEEPHSEEQLIDDQNFMNLNEYFSDEENSEDEELSEEDVKILELSQTNKTVKALLELRESLGENYEYTNELRDYINELGIYKVEPETISLQEAVKYSRQREKNGYGKNLNIDESEIRMIKDFLSTAYDRSDIGIIFHKLHYPEDYQWIKRYSHEVYKTYPDFNKVFAGGHSEDYSTVDVDDVETWPTYDVQDVDVDVECEINFQNLLEDLKIKIEKTLRSEYIDVVLYIPYLQLSKATSYEIRTVDFLRQLKLIPRVSVGVLTNSISIYDRAFFELKYLQIFSFK